MAVSLADSPVVLSQKHRRSSFEYVMEVESKAALDDLFKYCTLVECAQIMALRDKLEKCRDARVIEHDAMTLKNELRLALIKYDREKHYVVGEYVDYLSDDLECPVVYIVLRPIEKLVGSSTARRKTY